MGKYNQRTYVNQLPKNIQKGIRDAIIRNERKYGVPESAIRRNLPGAMNSRLGDLEEIINVRYWVDKANGKVKG